MNARKKALKITEEYYRLIGKAESEATQAAYAELGAFVVDNHDWLLRFIESAPQTGEVGLKLVAFRRKYLSEE